MSPKSDKHPDKDIQAYRETLTGADLEDFDKTLSLESHLEIQPHEPPPEPREPEPQEPAPQEPAATAPPPEPVEPEPTEPEPVEPEPTPEPPQSEIDVDAITDPALKSYLLELQKGNDGQRQALARRAEQLRAAKKDRDEAVRALLYQRQQFTAAPTAPPAELEPAPAPTTTVEGIPVEVDAETGEARITPEALDQYMARREEPAQNAVNHERQRMAAATRLVSSVPPPIQEKLMTAFHEMNNTYASKVQELAVQHRNISEGLVFMHSEGIAQEIATKYDCEVEDLVDMFQGSRDPWGFGHNLTRVGSKYTARWGDGQPAPPTAAQPSSAVRPIADHPRSLAKKGTVVSDSKTAVDEIINMDMEGSQKMTEEYFQDLVKKYEKETASTR